MPGDGAGDPTKLLEHIPNMDGLKKSNGPDKDVLPQYTLEQVGQHSAQNDCWIAISGLVYDVTSWLKRHPGGEFPIMGLAGREATDAFIAFHPPRASLFLKQFVVGRLADSEKPPLEIVEYREMVQQLMNAGLLETDMRWYGVYWAIMFLTWATVIAGVLLTRSFAIHVACGALLGLFWNQCLFMGHDLGHMGVTHNSDMDRTIGRMWTNVFAGVAMAWWQKPHYAHHITCNSVDYDPDIQQLPVFAMSKRFLLPIYSHYHHAMLVFDWASKLLVSWQHVTIYPLILVLGRPNLYLQSLLTVFLHKNVRNRGMEIGSLVVFWSWYFALLWALPNLRERFAFLAASYMTVAIIHIQIILSHSPAAATKYADRPANYRWLHTHVDGTINWTCPRWMDWFHGGLHYQIEHHLFPRMPRHNFRRASVFVREFCKRHGIAYRTTTFLEINLMLWRTLYDVAMAARKQPIVGMRKEMCETGSWKVLDASWSNADNEVTKGKEPAATLTGPFEEPLSAIASLKALLEIR